mmetsp:Transcript_2851/g.7390  ORF Transcript_2851/g.7390 Transcript_2851/m.7390 type:complete len:264 (+) Transcript_2851:488-1279(+)
MRARLRETQQHQHSMRATKGAQGMRLPLARRRSSCSSSWSATDQRLPSAPNACVSSAGTSLTVSSSSSSCSSLRLATILSIISRTLVKVSSCTDTARVESCERGPFEAPARPAERRPRQAERRSSASKSGEAAALRSAPTALERRMASSASACETERSCRKDTVLARCSRLSSSVRMAMVSATAVSSAARVLLRLSHCVSMLPQVIFRFCRNSTSLERCSRSIVRSSLASARAFWLAASWPSISSSFFSPAAIWSSLATLSSA